MKSISILFVCLSLMGCQGQDEEGAAAAVPHQLGGVNVGNPATGPGEYRTYVSTAFHFGVTYPAPLVLTVESEWAFHISNEAQTKRDISKISFKVLKAQGTAGISIGSLDELRAYLTAHTSLTHLESIHLPGAEGLFYESIDSRSLQGDYYLITQNSDLIYVHNEAYETANGLASVAPIIRSLVYDNKAPAILEIRMDPAVVEAGGQARLLIHATDDLSGIAGEIQLALDDCGRGSDNRIFSDESNVFQLNPVEGQKDWYSADLHFHRYPAPGDYCLAGLALSDRIAHGLFLESGDLYPARYVEREGYADERHAGREVIRFGVKNEGLVDMDPPTVMDFYLDTSLLQAGQSAKFFVRAIDELSGIEDFSRGVGCPHFEKVGGDEFNFGLIWCGLPQAEGDGWYSIPLHADPKIASGDYRLMSFSLGDQGGNESHFLTGRWCTAQGVYCINGVPSHRPVLFLQVANSQITDEVPPVIYSIQVPTEANAGESLSVTFEAWDQDWGEVNETFIFYEPLVPQGDSFFEDSEVIPLTAVAENRFACEVPLQSTLPAGDYALTTIYLNDASYNKRLLRADIRKVRTGEQLYYEGAGEVQIPIVKFRINR